MYGETRIDLHLPRLWNNCTTAELEHIARVVSRHTAEADRYHPFSMDNAKAELFFVFTGIEAIEPVNQRTKVEEQYVTCRFVRPKFPHVMKMIRWFFHERKNTFTLYLWQISDFINKNLKWLNGESQLYIFPYQRMYRWAFINCLPRRKRFGGAETLMQDFTWQRYRFAQEYMSFYIDQANGLLKMQESPSSFSDEDIQKKLKDVDLARAMFLATIFVGRVRLIDHETMKFKSTYSYQSNQHSDNAPYFRNFDEVKWQVVLFWWSGMMNYLQSHYPHCFKKTKVSNKATNPLDLYTRTTATMQKYTQLKAEDVDNQPSHIILQHLEDMAKENEELERMRQKNK